MTPKDLPKAAQLLAYDVVLVQCHLAKALEQLAAAGRGFPSGADGTGDGDDGSIVERLAAIGPDRAELDHTRLLKLMDTAGRAVHDLACLTREWSLGTVGGVRATGKADDDLYCPHCATHGVRDSLRAKDRKLCARCYRVLNLFGVLPNAALYEKWRSGHERLDPDVCAKLLGVPKRRDVA